MPKLLTLICSQCSNYVRTFHLNHSTITPAFRNITAQLLAQNFVTFVTDSRFSINFRNSNIRTRRHVLLLKKTQNDSQIHEFQFDFLPKNIFFTYFSHTGKMKSCSYFNRRRHLQLIDMSNFECFSHSFLSLIL